MFKKRNINENYQMTELYWEGIGHQEDSDESATIEIKNRDIGNCQVNNTVPGCVC